MIPWGNLSGQWVKYSDYELIGEQIKYIIPAHGAKATIYNAADLAPRILSDLLNAGRMITENQQEAALVERQCMLFVRKYGLMGWLTYIPPHLLFLSEDRVPLGKNGELFGETALTRENYLKFFYPREEKSEQSIVTATDRDEIFDLVFDKNYAEPLIWIAVTLMSLYGNFQAQLERATKGKKNAGDGEPVLESTGVTFRLLGGAKPVLVWEPNSQITMLELFYSSCAAEEDMPLRLCKHCNKIYYNTNARSEFCSPRCRNQFNVYKSRERNLGK